MGDRTGNRIVEETIGGLFVVRTEGPSSTTPVLLLHGFSQDHRCWGRLGELAMLRGACLLVDAPGHGRSTAPADLDLPATAALLAEVAASTGGPVDVVGYSMGGRTALQLLVDHPGTVRRAVLIGATAGIADDAERAARAEQDRATAARLEEVGLDAFLDEWLDQPLFAGLPEDARFDRCRRDNTVDGLAASLRHAGTGSMAPLWGQLAHVRTPVLGLAGADDTKFCGLGERLAAALPHGEFTAVPRAGHAAHLYRGSTAPLLTTEYLDGSLPSTK
jgi:2-succinyl-6-hydroxy-2,4-cyclohexadiene-1-carboxylate synthase